MKNKKRAIKLSNVGRRWQMSPEMETKWADIASKVSINSLMNFGFGEDFQKILQASQPYA